MASVHDVAINIGSSITSEVSHPSKIKLLAQDISRSFSNYGYQQRQVDEILSSDDKAKVQEQKLLFIRVWVICLMIYLLFIDIRVSVNGLGKDKPQRRRVIEIICLGLDCTIAFNELFNLLKKINNLTLASLIIL